MTPAAAAAFAALSIGNVVEKFGLMLLQSFKLDTRLIWVQ
jgi:hypothetical protein